MLACIDGSHLGIFIEKPSPYQQVAMHLLDVPAHSLEAFMHKKDKHRNGKIVFSKAAVYGIHAADQQLKPKSV